MNLVTKRREMICTGGVRKGRGISKRTLLEYCFVQCSML